MRRCEANREWEVKEAKGIKEVKEEPGVRLNPCCDFLGIQTV